MFNYGEIDIKFTLSIIFKCVIQGLFSLFRLLGQNITDWVTYKQQRFIFYSLVAGSPRSGCQQGQARALFRRADFLCPYVAKGWGNSLGNSAGFPLWRYPSHSWSSTLKAPLLNTVTLGWGFQHEFFRDTNIQTKAAALSAFTVLYDHHHYLFPELFLHPKQRLCIHYTWISCSPLPTPTPSQ